MVYERCIRHLYTNSDNLCQVTSLETVYAVTHFEKHPKDHKAVQMIKMTQLTLSIKAEHLLEGLWPVCGPAAQL